MFYHQSSSAQRKFPIFFHSSFYDSTNSNLEAFQSNFTSLSSHPPITSYEESRNKNENLFYDRKTCLSSSSLHHESTSFINYRKKRFGNIHFKSQITQQNFDRCKSELIRTQSMNSIYSTQKIQMLTKINTILENHSNKFIPNFINPEKIQDREKSSLRKKMNAKIDRLEGYLLKIKQQRKNQRIAKQKVDDQTVKIQQKQQKNFKAQYKAQVKNVHDVFKDLDKLKKQIGRARDQAIEVKKRNSVSHERSIKKIEVDQNFRKIKEQIAKLSNLQSKINSQSSTSFIRSTSSNNQFPANNISNQEISFNVRKNNHVSSFQFQKAPVQLRSQLNLYQKHRNHEKSMLKPKIPKITFSFAPKI